MIEFPRCSLCAANDWEEIGRRSYRSSVISGADDYTRRRLRVLFEVWYPGRTEVILRSVLCRNCGFVTYRPRPEEDDLDRKYRFLMACGPELVKPPASSPTERLRARRLWRKLRRYLPHSNSRVLDFGGNDGRLMSEFAEHGHECFLVDYNPQVIPGVRRCGSTIDELPSNLRFDAVVCSHVLEHLAEPCAVLSRLALHVNEGGLIYVEVPMEIWRKAPLHNEPVTHVNFFTLESLRALLQRGGLRALDLRLEGYRHPSGDRAVVVSALGRRLRGRCRSVRSKGNADAVRRLLNPSLTTRMHRALLNPSRIPAALTYRIFGRKLVDMGSGRKADRCTSR